MGTFGKLSVKAPRWRSEPREAGRANTLTIFLEMRLPAVVLTKVGSNFSKNEHKIERVLEQSERFLSLADPQKDLSIAINSDL